MAKTKIVMMANQIARNLALGHGDPAVAIASHINSFWDPRMRAQLLKAIETQPGKLSDQVIKAKPLLHISPDTDKA